MPTTDIAVRLDPEILITWLNNQLTKVGGYVSNLNADLRDGRNLMFLIGVLLGQQIPRKRGRLRTDMLENARTILDVLEGEENDNLTEMTPEDIVDGNPKQIYILLARIMQLLQLRHRCLDESDECTYRGSQKLTGTIPHQYLDDIGVSAEISTETSMWLERMNMLVPIRLPYEKTMEDVEPKWEITTWSQPILEARLGDAKRMLLDAFVIYLARVVGDTVLHIGWTIGKSIMIDGDIKESDVTVPMLIEVPLDEPWGSVSEALDKELVILAKIPAIFSDHVAPGASDFAVSSVEAKQPWRIVISTTVDHPIDTENPMARGTVLTLHVKENGEFRWTYNASYLSSEVVERITEHLRELVADFLAKGSTETPVSQLNILSSRERIQLLSNRHSTEELVTSDACLHHLYERQVLRTPQAVALIHGNEKITYGDLNARANRLAHYLIDLGLKIESLVGICVSVSPGMIIGMLAVLKAGGAYVPLDPLYPRQRLVDIISDTSVRIIIADEIGFQKLETKTLATCTIIDPNSLFSQSDVNPSVNNLNSHNLAYVMYTSGTTGQPKGVMVEHRSIATLYNAAKSRYEFDELDVWCLFHSIAFTVSQLEIWGAFSHGARLVLLSRDTVHSSEAMYRVICEQGVTVLHQTPSSFNNLVDEFINRPVPRHLRYVLFGGEPFDPEILRPLYVANAKKVLPRFINLIGASEIPFHVVSKVIDENDIMQSLSIIGKPLPGVKIHLLDTSGSLVPFGAIGELYVGGAFIARGYLNRTDLTSERFFPDPFDDSADARMYKTGDLAKYLSDGNLVFMGRNDQQIKLRGFRIEPREIIECLKSHPAVKDALVYAVGDEPEKVLVSYVIAEAVVDLVEILHRHLVFRLPNHMIPSAFVRLEQFPLTLNGKLDIKALPSVDEMSFVRGTYEAPKTDYEIILASVWGKQLGLQRIGRYDSFFALGGHSLSALRVIRALRDRGLTVNVSDLFQNSVLSDLARTVSNYEPLSVPPNLLTADNELLRPEMLPLIELTQFEIDNIVSNVPGGLSTIQDIYELSPLQHGMLYHHLLSHDDIDPYLITRTLAFPNRETLDDYLNAFQSVVDKHDIMRTSFFWKGLSKPAQVVQRRVELSVIEVLLETFGDPGSDDLYKYYVFRGNYVNLNEAPLIRVVIGRESDGRWFSLFLIHHLIMDAATVTAMDEEIAAHIRGNQSALRLAIPFRNYIAQMRASRGEKVHDTLFTKMLADIDEPSSCFGVVEKLSSHTRYVRSVTILESGFSNRLRDHAKATGVGLATLCHLAWALVASRTSGNKRVVFGTVLSSRMVFTEGTEVALGLFINTLPIRIDIDETPTCVRLQRTKERLSELLRCEHASLAQVQRRSRLLDDVPLFNSLLNFRQKVKSGLPEINNSQYILLQTKNRTNYPVVLSVNNNEIDITLEVDVFEPIEAFQVRDYMQEALQNLSLALECAPQQQICSIDVIPAAQRRVLLEEWNDTPEVECDFMCLHQAFERQVTQNPTMIALSHRDDNMTYNELNARANRLARHLIELDVLPGTLVGLCVSISPAMLVGLLAILKAGAAYLPLDTSHPRQRSLDITNDASIRIVIADEVGICHLGAETLTAMKIVDPNDRFQQSDENLVARGSSEKSLAYVIYTSGSTGRPKGVMIEHRNVARLFHVMDDSFDFDMRDVWCLRHTITFDVSVWEIWGALRNGGRLVLMTREEIRSIEDTYNLICKHRISVLNQTPSEFRLFIDKLLGKSIPGHLHHIILAGESLDPCILKPMYERHRDVQIQFHNFYGPTETTVFATYIALNEINTRSSVNVIGRGLTDTRTYLLDEYRRPVPFGTIGELYISGSGVARGYLNRDDLTRDRFILDPFSDALNARMYQTGDLARRLPNGCLEFIGRTDQQVKIRGYRIELGEIEACLKSHAAVLEARVIIQGDKLQERLIAYVVTNTQDDMKETLRSHVSSHLPEFMVPAAIIRIDAIPLTHNGKIDLRALPALKSENVFRNTYEAPEGNIETIIASIWKDILNVEYVSRRDSFFALGGHSLDAMQMIERVRCHGYELTIEDLYARQTLCDLVVTLKDNVRSEVPDSIIIEGIAKLTPDMLPLIDLTQTDIDHIVSETPNRLDNIQDIYALSPLQDGMLFHHLLDSENDPYLIVTRKIFADRLVLDRYISAFRKVVDRHDVLRTAFYWKNLSKPVQVVFRKVKLSVTEKTLEPNSTLHTHHSMCSLNQRGNYFDLQQAPLFKFEIFRENNGNWTVYELFHHMIVDQATLEILNHEIHAILNEQEETLPTPTQFRNFIAHVRSSVCLDAYEKFFKEMLVDINEPTLCFGLTKVHSDGSGIMESDRKLSCEMNVELRLQAGLLNVSPATLFHVVWGLVASRSTGQDRIVFGTVLFGRISSGNVAESRIGLYINTLPIKMVIDGTPFINCIRQTHERLGELMKYEHFSLVMAQRCSNISNETPLFNSLFNYRHGMAYARYDDIIPGMRVISTYQRSSYPVLFSVDDDGSSFSISSQTAEPVDPNRVCSYVQKALESVVKCSSSESRMSVNLIEILPNIERQNLLETWNTVHSCPPELICLHQHFEKQVILMSTKIALKYENQEMTYAELNARANSLAHHLIELGVEPGCLVGLCVTPSFDMIIGILAILKAGGAYVPLDPEYPSQRISQIIADAQLNVIVADDIGRIKLEAEASNSKILVNLNEPLTQSDGNPVVRILDSRHLAYIIYTSGSTGHPKGVMVEHRNATRLFDAADSLFRFSDEDIWSLTHSIAFDVSVWEIWGALRYGGQLVLIPREVVRSVDATYELICKYQVSVLNQTPSQFVFMIDKFVAQPVQDQVRYIIFAGESLDPSFLRKLYDVRATRVPQICNMYGTTETTVHSTIKFFNSIDTSRSLSCIGEHLQHTRIYLLDADERPVPSGVVGELYIGGLGVAQGYLDRSDLTHERFLVDPFGDSLSARMYKTGDLARYMTDGNLEFIGRRDQQVKIRGYRIEIGEVEACLKSHEAVRDARVVMFGENVHQRLVAYVVADGQDDLKQTLHLLAMNQLPEFMIPSAILMIDTIPLTHNGKLDRQALPIPDGDAYYRSTYEAPRGDVETKIAEIWSEILGVEDISRNDSFFALGGHSLLAVHLMEKMRRFNYEITIRTLFSYPVLSQLALKVTGCTSTVIPDYVIPPDVTVLTPDMFPLIDLTQPDIDLIINSVPGGIQNIQDIYCLSPLQDGILFHHLLNTENDPYLLKVDKIFCDIDVFEKYVTALQQVISRHNILRTAIFWRDLSSPAQVVFRNATLMITEKAPEPNTTPNTDHCTDDYTNISSRNPCYHKFNLQRAPLLELFISRREDGGWILRELIHHIIADHTTLEILHAEVNAILSERQDDLRDPTPFRNFIAHVRTSMRSKAAENFFTQMLTDTKEPTLCFGLTDVRSDGSRITESYRTLSQEMNDQLRLQAGQLSISPATVCHLACGLVVSRTSGRENVVFGTVFLGRMFSGSTEETQMGLYMNTLPFKLVIDNTRLLDCVKQTHETLGRLMEYEHASLVIAQRCSEIPSGSPLFNCLLNYRHDMTLTKTVNMFSGLRLIDMQERTNYPLMICMNDHQFGFSLSAQTAEPINPERLCGYMQRALESMTDNLTRSPGISVNVIDILPDSEREMLLETWNTVHSCPPEIICLHQHFEKQVILKPNKIALKYENEEMTYAELNARANSLAHHLIELGVGPERLVGICVTPSFAMIIGILAILKAGGAYVPLDPTYPKQRLFTIIDDASLTIVLADEIGGSQLESEDPRELVIINPKQHRIQAVTNPIVTESFDKNLAYVVYTSGSTGHPKGVMVEHRNVTRLFAAADSSFRFGDQDIWSLTHSIAFDVSVWEMWGALRYGGQLVLIPREVVRSVDATYELICKYQVSVLNQTPSQFVFMIDKFVAQPVQDQVRYIIFAGESLDPSFLRKLYDVRATRVPHLCNMYGTTETTIHSTITFLNSIDTSRSLSCIGEHLPHTRIYLLDADHRPVPSGVVGELYIGGLGVAQGYLNRSDLTHERFLVDPFSDSLSARMYKTGDLARYLPDGNLEFIGRRDQQVKIRGYRIEIGEVETCLKSHEAVRDARVLMFGENIHQRLVAYVVADGQHDLKQTLHLLAMNQLPEFMVPSAILMIDTIPLTHNGKLDRQALPIPDGDAYYRSTYEAPRGDVETKIAEIWSEILGVEDISRNDSFFALGGHSLLAVHLMEKMRRFNYEITIRTLFSHPVLSQLALKVTDCTPTVIPDYVIPPDATVLTPDMFPLIDLTQPDIDLIVTSVPGGIQNIQDIYSLSSLQDGILFHHLLNTENDPYVVLVDKICLNIDVFDKYVTALQQVISRHDILRTAIFWRDLSSPAQVVFRNATLMITEKAPEPNTTPNTDHCTDDYTNISSRNPCYHKFNLQRAPLLELNIFRREDGGWILRELIHHIIADHTSLGILHAEINAILSERQNDLRDPTPFRNFIAHVRTSMHSKAAENFFTRMLSDTEEPTLCFGLADVRSNGSRITESHQTLSQEINDQLRLQAGQLGISPATVCHLACGLVVSRTSGRENVVFGTVFLGRMFSGSTAETQMGLYLNTLPLKLVIDDTRLLDCVKQTHETLGRLMEYEHVSLVIAQRCSGIPSGAPLFNCLLNYRHDMTPTKTVDMLSGMRSIDVQGRTNYPLMVCMNDHQFGFSLSSQTAEPINSERICGYMQSALKSVTEGLSISPEISVNVIDILPDSEREMLLETWNTVHSCPPEIICLHQHFEKQVILKPTKIALKYENEEMTYAELNARANSLAHHLIELGVGPERLVGVCVTPSFAMIIGIMAILKAGGAYVPLDPTYPKQRLFTIIDEASLTIVLADEIGSSQLECEDPCVLVIINPNQHRIQAVTNPIVAELFEKNLAYVMYTSGSTGRPKGVMVEHRNIVRLFDSMDFLVNFDQNDVWSLGHSIVFDVSVAEIWGALRYGGQLVIVPRDAVRSPNKNYDLIRDCCITVLNQTITEFNLLIDQMLSHLDLNDLRYIVLSGEFLDPRILAPLHAGLGASAPKFINMYGPTEATVYSTFKELKLHDMLQSYSNIGKGLTGTNIYLLDDRSRPVPVGIVGEIYVGGSGVARGYLNKPNLTSAYFQGDEFGDCLDSRMYKTGDLARYLPDGNLEFIGRRDQQVKIRGHRIEIGEVEACLKSHEAVRDARVLMFGENVHQRLVAYVVADGQHDLKQTLRVHAMDRLPEFMVPSAILMIDTIPLTHNGKLDRQALPIPDGDAYYRSTYEAPRGDVETKIAKIWSELLDVGDISRNDSFFALGGHSLLAMQVIAGLRSQCLSLSLSNLFRCPVLSHLALCVQNWTSAVVPPNVLTVNCEVLTPEMLPLVDLTQRDIDHIVSNVPGGLHNIQDIYGLSPLQDGMLFHHLLSEKSDPYVIIMQLAFQTYDGLISYLDAYQRVIDRHDILRTAIFWEGLSTPVQVVHRRVTLPIIETTFETDVVSLKEQLTFPLTSDRCKIDLNEAPLIRAMIARDCDDKWILHCSMHHLINDGTTLRCINAEILALMTGDGSSLKTPYPFRNHIAVVRAEMNGEVHLQFFAQMLSDINEPCLVFDITQMHVEATQVNQSKRDIKSNLDIRMRDLCKSSDVSLAALCHLAWALVVSWTSGKIQAVFGTVLFGRTGIAENLNSEVGIYMNTLPMRVDVDSTPAYSCLHNTQTRLSKLLEHQYASLASIQRCCGIGNRVPFFNSLFNFRTSSIRSSSSAAIAEFEVLRIYSQSNYPVTIAFDDDGMKMAVEVYMVLPFESSSVCCYMEKALVSLMDALESIPNTPMCSLYVCPDAEYELHVDNRYNGIVHSDPTCIHILFERQVARNAAAIALVYEDQKITYGDFNSRANKLAHRLIELGVVPGRLVGICASVSISMLVGIMAILKAGGAYVPLDPEYPTQRISQIIADAQLNVIVADDIGRIKLEAEASNSKILVNLNEPLTQSDANPVVRMLDSRHLAYIIYTSGSTGHPKGVMVEHRNATRLFDAADSLFRFSDEDIWSLTHSIAFDFSVWEIWGALRYGGQLVLIPREVVRSVDATYELICKYQVSVLNQTPIQFVFMIDKFVAQPVQDQVRYIIFGGESLNPNLLRKLYDVRATRVPQLCNMYGTTETTVHSTLKLFNSIDTLQSLSCIGKHLPHTYIYLLDANHRPVPSGVVGELYIGGPGVTQGYLNRPDLTSERFLPDSFSDSFSATMYKTGDLARYSSDGDLVIVGRNDQQIKIRGFRLERNEIEICLTQYPGIRQAAVVPTGDGYEKVLIAYIVSEARENLSYDLREYLLSLLPEYMIPSRYVRLDSFPLTLNGKLDVRALSTCDDVHVARTSYEMPATHTEWELAMIWSQLLKINQVGRNDNFFVLGGHSLLAMRMIALAAEKGLACTLNDLFRYPVLVDLATKISTESESPQKYSAIPVRPQGTGPPLFFVATGSGDYSYVFSLSQQIVSSCPIYALSWQCSRDQSPLTIEELAQEMIPSIKVVQPRGPYQLCSYSIGGFLCHAIADRLLRAGDSVSFVGLIDTVCPKFHEIGKQFRQFIVFDFLTKICGFKKNNDPVTLYRKMHNMSFLEIIETVEDLDLFPSDVSSKMYAQQMEQALKFLEMTANYVPRELDVIVHEFSATDRSKPEAAACIDSEFEGFCASTLFDQAYSLPSEGFRIIPIPGDHLSMMENLENRSVLGQAISTVLPEKKE